LNLKSKFQVLFFAVEGKPHKKNRRVKNIKDSDVIQISYFFYLDFAKIRKVGINPKFAM
jgi:hypothetical protein